MKRITILLAILLFLSLFSISAKDSDVYYTEGNGVFLTSFGIGNEYGRVNVEGNFYTPIFTAFIYNLFPSPQHALQMTILFPFIYTSLEGKVSYDLIGSEKHDLDLGVATDFGVSIGFTFLTASLEPFVRYTWNFGEYDAVFLEASCPLFVAGLSFAKEAPSFHIATFPDIEMVTQYTIMKSKIGFIKRY